MENPTRRQLLATTAAIGTATMAGRPAGARVISRALPWSPNEAYPSTPVVPGPWQFFTAEEAAAVEAIANRLIPADDLGPGGKDAGCAVFIDRQLVGPYGNNAWLYMEPPFVPDAAANFGLQSPVAPARRYRDGLAALASYTRQAFGGRLFHQLDPADQDAVLTGLEKGDVKIADGKAFFNQVQANVVEGYFADPIYGGNKDMCGWKLVGFPGVRYDYRDVIDNPNRPYTLPPVSLMGRGTKEAAR
ncbi:MAG: gluconate 2-dehydrogenase subunit 3 family protein [Janthinobacterium lividum]